MPTMKSPARAHLVHEAGLELGVVVRRGADVLEAELAATVAAEALRAQRGEQEESVALLRAACAGQQASQTLLTADADGGFEEEFLGGAVEKEARRVVRAEECDELRPELVVVQVQRDGARADESLHQQAVGVEVGATREVGKGRAHAQQLRRDFPPF